MNDQQASAHADTITLSQVRAKYLGKQVVVTGPLFNEQSMLEWHSARLAGARFVESGDSLSLLLSSYRGQTGVVVTVQLNRLKVQTKVNALGEFVNDDDTVDPYFDLIVKFQDGSYGMLTTYPTTAEMSVRFLDEQQGLAEMIKNNQDKLIGASLYACAFSHLYEPDSSLEEMTGSSEILKRISVTRTPLLQRLPIQNLRFVPGSDVVVMKLKLPDGSSALAYTPLLVLHNGNTDKLSSPLEKIAGFFFTSIPQSYSAKEVESVQKRELFRGMTKDALDCALGLPEKENDWGKGGKQLVFFGSLFVYLDHADKVVDWQSIDK